MGTGRQVAYSISALRIVTGVYAKRQLNQSSLGWSCLMHTAQPEWNSTHIVFALERNRAYHMPFGLYTLRIDRCARLSHEQRDRVELVPGKSQTRS